MLGKYFCLTSNPFVLREQYFSPEAQAIEKGTIVPGRRIPTEWSKIYLGKWFTQWEGA